jgi:hypothetical protein
MEQRAPSALSCSAAVGVALLKGATRAVDITATSFTGEEPLVVSVNAPVPVPGVEPVGDPTRTTDSPAPPDKPFNPYSRLMPSPAQEPLLSGEYVGKYTRPLSTRG